MKKSRCNPLYLLFGFSLLFPFCEKGGPDFQITDDGEDDGGTKTGVDSGDIIVTEIMANPQEVSDERGEWFEVYNTTRSDIDLNGVEIMDAGGETVSVSAGEGLIISSRSYLVFGKNDDTSENGGVKVDYLYSGFNLGNSSDSLYIYYEEELIDAVVYSQEGGFPVPEGASFALDPSYYDSTYNDSGEYWCESTAELSSGDRGTPGEVNGSCVTPDIDEGEIIVTEIMANPAEVDDDLGEWFEIYNTSDRELNINGVEVVDGEGNTFTVDNGGNPLTIDSGVSLVLGRSDNEDENGGAPVDYVYTDWTLRDTDDEIILMAGDVEIDRVEYDNGDAFPETPEGASLQLSSDAYDFGSNDTGGNWCESTQEMSGGDRGTPGSVNDQC